MYCKIFTCTSAPRSINICCHCCERFPLCTKRGEDVCKNSLEKCRLFATNKKEVIPITKKKNNKLWYKFAFDKYIPL